MTAFLKDVIGYGTHAARPAAGSEGALYYESDTDTLFRDSGSAWITLTLGSSSPLTTKGDLLTHSTVDARLPVGTDGQVLTADSTQTLGVKWATAGGGGSGALTKLAESVLGSSAANITFASISGAYRSLLFVWAARTTSSGGQDALSVQFNSDTGANYDHERFMAYSTSTQILQTTAATSAEVGQIPGGTASANCFTGGELLLPNYASTTMTKHGSARGGHGNGGTTDPRITQNSLFWRSTAAITQVLFLPGGGSLAAGTVITLYGMS